MICWEHHQMTSNDSEDWLYYYEWSFDSRLMTLCLWFTNSINNKQKKALRTHDWKEVILQHEVYKVETIGDAYMIVGGVPDPCENHAERVLNVSIGMLMEVSLSYCETAEFFKFKGGHTLKKKTWFNRFWYPINNKHQYQRRKTKKCHITLFQFDIKIHLIVC